MRAVHAESHSGFPVVLYQCPNCGGLWFDKLVLYSTKQGEASRIEDPLNFEKLKSPKVFEMATLHCPVDALELQPYKDAYFPKAVHVHSCPKCGGFWLNRGEFMRFQESRSMVVSTERSKADDIFHREVELLLQAHHEGGKNDSIAKLAKFLSKSMQSTTLKQLDLNLPASEEKEKMIVGLLLAIFSALVGETADK